MAEPHVNVENPCVQGGGEPIVNTPDLETKVNKLQSQLCDMTDVLGKLTETIDRFVKNENLRDCRSEMSEYRTIDRLSEPDHYTHTLPCDAEPVPVPSSGHVSSNRRTDRLPYFDNFQCRPEVRDDIGHDRFNPDPTPYNQQSVVCKAKPDTYDGRSTWTDFITHFEIVCSLNKWPSEIKALQLAASLRGTARSVLTDLRPRQLENYHELKDALQTRFEPKNQTEMYRAQMNGRYRKRNESLSELAQDIKRLARLAYPTAPCEVRDTLAYKCFRDALCDQNMEWAICQGSSENIDEALNLALKFEAFTLGRDRKFNQALRFQQEISDSQQPAPVYAMSENSHNLTRLSKNNETKKCFYCGKAGHFRNVCRKRMHDMQKAEKNRASRDQVDVNTEVKSVRDQTSVQSLNDQRLSL